MDKWCWATRTALGKIWEVCQNHWPFWEDLTLNPGSYSEKLPFLLCRKERTCCMFRINSSICEDAPRGLPGLGFRVYLHAAYCPHSTGWIAVLLIGLYKSLNSTPICCYCLRAAYYKLLLAWGSTQPKRHMRLAENPQMERILDPKP